jgi:hypothetical protein
MTAKEWFEEADRKFLSAVQRVMTARTTADPMGMGKDLDWAEFNEWHAEMVRCAAERHAAKHAAIREAVLAPLPTTIYRDGSALPEGSDT